MSEHYPVTDEVGERGGTYQMIHVPNLLRAKVGEVKMSLTRLAEAEAVVASFAELYPAEAMRQIDAMRAAWSGRTEAGRADACRAVHAIAHDMKGQGETFGFPLLSKLGASLCSLLAGVRVNHSGADQAIKAHIDAMALVAARKIHTDGEAGAELGALLDQVMLKTA